MRVRSLIILVAIAAVVAYFVLFTPPWAFELVDKVRGYGPASTPTEAQDKFLKAIKARDFKAAAKFCTGDYAEQLKRAAPTQELGAALDGISEYMHNKGLASDKSVVYMYLLDPFPTNIKTGAAPKEIDANTAKGFFIEENIRIERVFKDAGDFLKYVTTLGSEQRQLDGEMFRKVLVPFNLFDARGFDIVKEDGSWKLKFQPPPPLQVQAIDHYVRNYKGYVTRLTVFRRELTNDRYPGKTEFERELVTSLQESKGN